MSQLMEKPASKVLPDDYWEGELVPRSDPRFGGVSANLERVSGTPCFVGTRVPIRNLWDYLEEGPSMEEFLAKSAEASLIHQGDG